MRRLKVRWRMVKLWVCRKRGHNVVRDQVVLGFKSMDVRQPDGTIIAGDSMEWWTIRCMTCHPKEEAG